MDLMGILIVAGCVVVGMALLAYNKGWLNTATEARLKALIAKGEHEVEVLREKLRAKQEKATEGAPVEVTLIKDKGTRLAENQALLDAKQITQAEFDAAKAKILSE